MIENIKHEGLRALAVKGECKGVRQEHMRRLQLMLNRMNAASTLKDMDAPGYHLHALKGDLKSFHAVRVSGNWRLIFRYENGKFCDVDYVDYH